MRKFSEQFKRSMANSPVVEYHAGLDKGYQKALDAVLAEIGNPNEASHPDLYRLKEIITQLKKEGGGEV